MLPACWPCMTPVVWHHKFATAAHILTAHVGMLDRMPHFHLVFAIARSRLAFVWKHTIIRMAPSFRIDQELMKEDNMHLQCCGLTTTVGNSPSGFAASIAYSQCCLPTCLRLTCKAAMLSFLSNKQHPSMTKYNCLFSGRAAGGVFGGAELLQG